MAKHTVVELEELRDRLREAEETLSAIRNGEVDSLIVTGPHGDQVFSLKGADQPYRVFVEQMLEGAVTITTSGMILYSNRRFAEMVRCQLEKVIGSSIQSFIRPSDQAELSEILSDPTDRKARYVLSACDGSLVPAQLAFSRLPGDEVEAICVVITDLTEQEEKRELATALSNLRIAQEQLQHQNDELGRARVAAEAASEAKDNFLAALSHELRTPLTPVLMTATVLENDASLPESVRQDLALLRRNVELEARLIDDLLDLTRIVRGKVELRTETMDLHSVLESALDICRTDVAAKRLHLVQDLRATHTHIEADAIRIQQILWNVLRNAVKFTPEAGQIIVRSDNGEDARQIWISIADTGIGIEADAIGRIFTPFEQAGRLITRQFGGLGLGLAISKRLVELHGGTITARSEGHDRGSVFTITLPTVSTPTETSARSPSQQDAHANNNARRLTILLVEDHDDTRRSMSRLLAIKHDVRDVQNIAAALNAAANERFDLVISDLGLPDGNGLDLMRQLRDRHGLKGICLTGYGMEDDLSRSAEAGFYHHLTKPVDFKRLESVIEQFIS